MGYWSDVSLRKRGKVSRCGLSESAKAALCETWGLAPGVVVVAYGGRFVFGRVGGVLADGRPWVWAYRLRKNGKTYSEPTRLDRWEVVK